MTDILVPIQWVGVTGGKGVQPFSYCYRTVRMTKPLLLYRIIHRSWIWSCSICLIGSIGQLNRWNRLLKSIIFQCGIGLYSLYTDRNFLTLGWNYLGSMWYWTISWTVTPYLRRVLSDEVGVKRFLSQKLNLETWVVVKSTNRSDYCELFQRTCWKRRTFTPTSSLLSLRTSVYPLLYQKGPPPSKDG